MPKAPYTFPHRSRAAIVDYLTRDGRSYHYQRYRFAWNVKVYMADYDGDTLRKHIPDLNANEDAAWQAHLDADGNLFWRFCEDAARIINDDEWTAYPGTGQGDWDFSFAGRCGGWIVLEKWQGRDVRDLDPEELADPEIWSWDDLREFYKGIRTADSDFTPRKASDEVEFQAAIYREQWEEGRDEARKARARCDEAARPDLYEIRTV